MSVGDPGRSVVPMDELDVARWIFREVAGGGGVPVVESLALVRLLSVRIRSERASFHLFSPASPGEYLATHALNSAALSMVLAAGRGLNPREVWEVGLAGLLHDIGMARLPERIRTGAGELSASDLEIVRGHCTLGARILIEADAEELAIPAVVAMEHHQFPDGGGYPARRLGRTPARASLIVQLCSIYDAMRTDRPHREALTPERCFSHLRSEAGGSLDEELVSAFLGIMSEWEPRRIHPDDRARSAGTSGEAAEERR